jgi:hypothetical protein
MDERDLIRWLAKEAARRAPKRSTTVKGEEARRKALTNEGQATNSQTPYRYGRRVSRSVE